MKTNHFGLFVSVILLEVVFVLSYSLKTSSDFSSRTPRRKQLGRPEPELRRSEGSPISGLMSTRLLKNSCGCVSIYDSCEVEMMEDSVLKVKGKLCPSRERYCCQRDTVRMGSETDSVEPGETDFTLRDIIASDFEEEPKPTTFNLFLQFVTESLKYFQKIF